MHKYMYYRDDLELFYHLRHICRSNTSTLCAHVDGGLNLKARSRLVPEFSTSVRV